MKLEGEWVFDGPVDKVVYILMESDKEITKPEELPNVKSRKVLKEKWEGDKKYITVEWCAHGEIPKAAQRIIKPKMLTWIEESVWDRKERTYLFKIKTHYFTNLVKCFGTVSFHPKGQTKTIKKLDGILEINIPLIGKIMEKAVARHLYINFDKEHEISSKKVKEMKNKI